MALMYLVVAKVLGFYEEQESLIDSELEVMLAETIGALIAFNSEDSKVAEAALSFLAFFGVNKKVEPRPKIYLTKEETNQADLTWGEKNVYNHRIVIAAGGGFDQKCWGDDNFSALTKLLLRDLKFKIYIIGSKEDKKRIRLRQNERVKESLWGTNS